MFSERGALVILIAISAASLGILALAAWRRRHNPLGRVFFLLSLVGAIYALGYLGELASDTLPAIRLWLRVESIGIAFLPTAWIALAVYHTGLEKHRRWPQLQAVLLMLSAITFILSNTSELHHLHYGPLRLNPEAPFPVAAFDPGPWYRVHMAFINLALLCGNVLYARSWLRKTSDKGQQAFILFLGSLFPWLAFIIYQFELIPWGVDPLPIAFLVPALLYAWATFGMGLLEIAPLARRAVFQKLSDGVLVFDREGRLADYNAAAGNTFPELDGTVTGKRGSALFRTYPAVMSVLAGPADGDRLIWQETGCKRASYQLQRSELFDGKGNVVGFMVVVRDVTNFATAMEGLRLQAVTDPLTKAWNRTRWQEEGEALLAQTRREKGVLSLILVDLDDFKQINDTCGHVSGDAVLEAFADTCRRSLRAEDIFGRYGGDEFIVILPGVDKAEAAEVAERIGRAVAAMTAGGEHKVSASFGVMAARGEEAAELIELVRQADEALYAAKSAGGNRVCVYEKPGPA